MNPLVIRADQLIVGDYYVYEDWRRDVAISRVHSVECVGDDVIINEGTTMSMGTQVVCLGKSFTVR